MEAGSRPKDRPSPWWDRQNHADRRAHLRLRGAITAAIRGWFAERDFVEVETGILQISPGNETHLHALCAEIHAASGATGRRYLRTSPEFSAKKLLAAGEERIFELARVFRDYEHGALHLPEFTMLEWYRAGEPYEAVIDDTLGLIQLAARTTEISEFRWRGRRADPLAQAERLTLHEAFTRYAGIDLLATLNGAAPDRAALARAATTAGIRVAEDDTWSDLFSKVLVEKIEPHMGEGRPTVLYEYPAPEAALARLCPHDSRVAERFEIFICGVELANGYGELVDPREQRVRFEHAMNEKARLYGTRYPLDEDFLAAIAHMPEASGVALGLDRLIMLAVGADRVDRVVWTPPAEMSQ